ncbi:MAG: rRNA pseudouridine synthase [Firmicutes bacterium]|nr:rRNA pseudouridine synthase [Bacillota bacterium]
MERLHKFLARCGAASRRECEKIISQGRVRVNGKTIIEPGFTVDPEKDKIFLDEKILKPEEKIYIILFKPRGCVSTVKDPQNRLKVIDLLKGIKQRVYPVGRLDYDSEGLLFLTNDGELANFMIHPRYEVEKVYLAVLDNIPGKNDLERLQRGIMLDDGKTSPSRVKVINEAAGKVLVEIRIHEGRKHQVKRMFEAAGRKVLNLKRVKMGPLELGRLKPGEYKILSEKEAEELKKGIMDEHKGKA